MATGPSLTNEQIEKCRGEHVVAVNNAMHAATWAEVGYACDAEWWRLHKGCSCFRGERWTSHSMSPRNDKRKLSQEYDLNIIEGRDESGFSVDRSFIHYGNNSGFQAVNLALLFGANPIILVGFDMRRICGKSHYFGDHPYGLGAPGNFDVWLGHFERAATMLPAGIEILNATPGSALACFPMADLEEVLSERDAA